MTGITGINEILLTLISLLPLIVPVLVIGFLVHLAERLVHHRKGSAEGRPMPPVPHWHTRPLRFSVWLRVFVTLAAMWAGVEVYAPMGDYVALGLWLVLIPAQSTSCPFDHIPNKPRPRPRVGQFSGAARQTPAGVSCEMGPIIPA
jgi:hypothetical protein